MEYYERQLQLAKDMIDEYNDLIRRHENALSQDHYDEDERKEIKQELEWDKESLEKWEAQKEE